MKRKLYVVALAAAMTLPVVAQDTYENARLLGSDLNGTARYVGMGGALEALGADISTISTNPAGIGLFRHSTASMTLGVVNQESATKFDNLSKTNLSFDQVGFVFTMPTGDQSFLNFAFNYHKGRNFTQLLSAANGLRATSLSKLAYDKKELGSDVYGGYDLGINDRGDAMGYRDARSNERAYQYTQWDYLYTNAFNYNPDYEDPTTGDKGEIIYAIADAYNFDRAHRGHIADYDFNVSGNVNDRVYLGLTLGFHDVNYKGYSQYSEGIVPASGNADGGVLTLEDERRIEGTGFDVKVGAIFRPFEESPFRFGLSIATPTWYDLTSSNDTKIYNGTNPAIYGWAVDGRNSESYDFKYYTPWKLGMSVGHTFGSELALGLSYEYADYSSSDTRIIDGYDYYGQEDSYSDEVMNGNTENSLKAVHTIKVGAEYKPTSETSVRLGYNYVSPMYNKSGVRDTYLNSIGNMYSSTTDYVNWAGTNRLTCGFGYRYQKLSLDLAYQYNVTKGDFHPFQSEGALSSEVFNKRHQIQLSVGYTF